MAPRPILIALCAAPFAACDAKPERDSGAQTPGTAPPAATAPTTPAAPNAEARAPEMAAVTIAGQKFSLEAALDDPVRIKGLGGRTEIAPRGGMLFVFPYSLELSFVMRDCVIPIDIAFLDSAGRVVAKHTMQPEPPRAENESPQDYENRLKKYSSRFAAQFAVEVKAGTLDALGVKEGDLLRFDAEGLKRRCR